MDEIVEEVEVEEVEVEVEEVEEELNLYLALPAY